MMHPHLRETAAALAAHFRHDPRAAGLYLWGSGATDTADEWSDVDLALVVEDAAYEAVSAELRGLCQRLAGRIALWFPEGRQPGYCNYAFLFEQDGQRFLCDFAVMTRSHIVATPFRRPERIVFDDAAGLLATLRRQREGGPYVPPRLEYEIDHYWIYCYLNGKYWKRRDLFKLLYVQQTLLACHLRVLRALHPDDFHEGQREWWPADARRLPEEVRPALLCYFPAPDAAAVRAALADEVSWFGTHARAACARWGRAYPQALEDYVLDHLQVMGVLHL